MTKTTQKDWQFNELKNELADLCRDNELLRTETVRLSAEAKDFQYVIQSQERELKVMKITVCVQLKKKHLQ